MKNAERTVRATYRAFNDRDVAGAVELMHAEVDWPNAWEGGRVVGRAAVVEYWTRQFTAISSRVEPECVRVEPDGSVTVDVRQVVRDARTGGLLSDAHVRHLYRLRDGLIARMGVLEPPAAEARYDSIGDGYAGTRREDPRIAARIHAALGGARTVVNVGAGAGSYEPHDRHVIAIEPSDVMAGQRPPGLAPAIRGEAHRLPLRDGSVDAAMAVLAVHHWDRHRREGVRELRRVARGPVVILTVDPAVSAAMWLMADYLSEVAELDRGIFPPPELLCEWLGGESRVQEGPDRA
jgi:ketosteroid isomerase-like protein